MGGRQHRWRHLDPQCPSGRPDRRIAAKNGGPAAGWQPPGNLPARLHPGRQGRVVRSEIPQIAIAQRCDQRRHGRFRPARPLVLDQRQGSGTHGRSPTSALRTSCRAGCRCSPWGRHPYGRDDRRHAPDRNRGSASHAACRARSSRTAAAHARGQRVTDTDVQRVDLVDHRRKFVAHRLEFALGTARDVVLDCSGRSLRYSRFDTALHAATCLYESAESAQHRASRVGRSALAAVAARGVSDVR